MKSEVISIRISKEDRELLMQLAGSAGKAVMLIVKEKLKELRGE